MIKINKCQINVEINGRCVKNTANENEKINQNNENRERGTEGHPDLSNYLSGPDIRTLISPDDLPNP